MIFPIGQNASLCVIEPGNITRLKSGHALKVGDHLVFFTPDMDALKKALGITAPNPERGEQVAVEVRIQANDIVAAILKCKDLPEVDRP